MENHADFWDMVEKLNYPQNHWIFKNNWLKANVFLLRRYSENTINQFYNTLNELARSLYPKFDKYDLSSDSRDDAACLAVSFGEKEYYNLLSNDDALEQFILKFDEVKYYESFKYCFHLDDSFI